MTTKLETIAKLATEIATEHAAQIAKLEAMLKVGKVCKDFRPIRANGWSISFKENSNGFYGGLGHFTAHFSVTSCPTWPAPNTFEHLSKTFPVTNEGLAAFRAYIAELENLDVADLEFNAKLTANNNAVFSALHGIIVSAGIPINVYKDVSSARSRNKNMKWVGAEWVEALRSQCSGNAHASQYRQTKSDMFRYFEDQVKKVAEMAKAKEAKEKADALTNPLTLKALEFLAIRGKKLDVDFTIVNAISVADDIRFVEIVDERFHGEKLSDFESIGDFTNMSVYRA